MAGSFSLFKGTIKDNKGKQIVDPGKSYAEDAIELESMDYLVEGVVGSTA
jgi:simple sugar transport system substrate-binding protein